MDFFARSRAAWLLPLVAFATACDDGDTTTLVENPGNIVQVPQEAGSFNTLLTALDVAALTGALEKATATITPLP